MPTTDLNTIRRIPAQHAARPEYAKAVREFAETIATPAARRALLAALGRAAA